MSNIDDLVNRWFLQKWTSGELNFYPFYNKDRHGPREDLKVLTTDGGWDCHCYSSWTRDDSKQLIAKVMTRKGEVEICYGTWGDFPQFVEDIIDFGNLEEFCSVERREKDNDC